MIERRRAERIRVADHLIGRVREVGDARIIDISLTGVLGEIRDSVQPDGSCHFSMPMSGDDRIHIEARGRRCEPSRHREDGLGNSPFLYRAGLEFIDVDPKTHSILDRCLSGIKQRSARPDTARIAQLVRDS